jgi:peptidoglycan hydrolase-like protein with peptidoglycan-binding domain
MMKFNRELRMTAKGLLAVTLIAGSGSIQWAAAQTKTAPTQPKKPAASTTKPGAKKALVRKIAARPRVQTAPTRERIIEIQQALGREGFYTDTPSGKWDAPTTQAMKDFQTAKGLTPTGKLGALSLQKLGLGSEIAGRGAPIPQADTRPSALSESELNEAEPPQEPTTN